MERAAQIPGADLSAVQLVDAASLPIGGTYWSVQRVHYPPAPCNWLAGWTDDFQVYWLGAGTRYLVDDRGIDYEALGELQTAGLFTMYGSGGDDSGGGGTPLYATNDLWLELISASILSPTNLSATLVVHTPEIYGVYDLFFKHSLPPSNAWYWVARGLPGQTNFTLIHLPVDGGFFILGTTNFTDTNGLTAAYRGLVGGVSTLTNDFDHDGLPDYWEIVNFGDLSQGAGGDYDGDGHSNGEEYASGSDPNEIAFSLQFPSQYANANSATGTVVVLAGVPASMTGIVNSTNFVTASWQPYGSKVVVSLGTNDGNYEVWVGLRGRKDTSAQSWREFTLTRDTVPPLLVITSAVPSATARPLLQLRGYGTEPLSAVTFSLTNAAGFLTNQLGYLVAQQVDTNSFKFTTNWFQCYDIPLTNGSNIISLRAVDLADNVTTTNLAITLDFSLGTNPPSFTVQWPPDNSLVAGTTFTLWGSIDDDTALVTVTGAGPEPVSGLVERGGRFRVQNLLLTEATNVLTINVTNAAGSGSSQQLTVRKSSVDVTINPISPTQLSGPTFTLSGTVGDGSQQVFVNGNPAAVNPSNNTYTIALPTPQGSSANIDVAAGPDISNIVARQSLVLDMPSRVRAAAYAESYYFFMQTICDGTPTFITARNRTWQEGVGGGSHEHDESPVAPPFTCDSQEQWPAYWPDGQTVAGTNCHGPFTETLSLPWQNGVFGTRSWFAGEIIDCGFGTIEQIVQRKAQTAIELAAGGPAESGGQRLIRLTVSAAGYSPALLNNPNAAGDVPIPASNILFAGQPLTPTATNAFVGEMYLAAAAGSTQSLPITVSGTNSQVYSFDAKAEEIKLSITANGITLDPSKVVTNANFIVGQVLTFSTNWSKVPPGVASRTVQWTFEGNFLNDSNQPCADCSPNYTTNQTKLTNEITSAWWVSGANPAAIYSAQLTETLTLNNGSNVVIIGKGLFSMVRPQASIDARTGTVALDTNMLIAINNGVPIYTLGLHFGVPTLSYTNLPTGPPGILLSNRYSMPSGFSGSFQWVQVISNCTVRYETNDASGRAIKLQATNVLDTTYPYNTDSIRAEDSPNANIDPPYCLSKRLTDSRSFATWLEFRPANGPLGPLTGQWVPLRQVAWGYSGEGLLISTNCAPTSWIGTNITQSVNPPDVDTERYPWWWNNITNFTYQPE